jgi:hypothetical protein
MEYITASCLIRNRQVHQNGKLVLEKDHGGLADFLLAAYQHFGGAYPKFYKMDQLSKLGWLAAEGLLSEGFRGGEYPAADVAVVLSNANASLDTDRRYVSTIADIPSPALFVYTLPNIVIGEICIRNTFKGENAFFVFDSFDASFIAGYVQDLFEQRRARACICGWVETLGEEYMAALFLVEQDVDGLPFTAVNMTAIMNTENTHHA